MEITEVRIKLMDSGEDRLRGFCSVTFDNCFVVRDLKIIDGNTGMFVAMPSRKLTMHCPRCRIKNHLRSRFCNQCGTRLPEMRADQTEGRNKMYADIAHPINAECREYIQNRIVEEYNEELERAKLPGYRSRYDDDYGGMNDAGEIQDNQFRVDQSHHSRSGLPHGNTESSKANPAGRGEKSGLTDRD